MAEGTFDLTEKVVIVTGSSRGIGRAIALGMARAGAAVVVTSRKLADSELVAQEIKALGGQSLPVAAHMRNTQEIQDLVQKVVAEFGRIDILINNAASALWGSLLRDEERTWDHQLEVNLKGPFLLSQAVAKVMVSQGGGSIVNIASIYGATPDPKMGIYSVSKAGLIMLTKAMAREWGPCNIRVNGVAPGVTRSKMSEAYMRDDPEELKRIESRTALRRMAEQEEMVGPVLFLASDVASYVTGQTLFADGGFTV